MKFYTTESLEKLNDEFYKDTVREKQREMNREEKRTKVKKRLSASCYTGSPVRIFAYEDGNYNMIIGDSTILCVNKKEDGGNVYCVDPEFKEKFNNFILNNPNYKIKFYIDNGTVKYNSESNVYPCTISSLTNPDIFEMYQNEDKFDLVYK